MAAEAAGDEAAPAPRPSLTFLNLPAETQQEILSHCSQSDLICVALVSKHFHELASAQLYRSFNILFPDDDDLRFDSPIDGLAGGLDTFTTSEYNYAKHLKELSMDTVSTGVKAEHAYKPYIYSASCGKFLNTLLSLSLRKAKSLETFRWNIRVELSRPVYRELHKIQTLTTLHIRMQAGESYYAPPPPLPLILDDAPPQTHWSDLPPPPLTPPFPSMGASGQPSSSSTARIQSQPGRRTAFSPEPPTLSGFKKLKSLSVLDIDSLDIVAELKTCVRNSSSTLKELNLSLSDSLASQARNSLSGDSDPEDSDVEDEFHVPPPSPPGSNFGDNGPTKTFRSQEERKLQESVLGRIFDVEPFIVKKSPFQRDPRDISSRNDKNDASGNEGAYDAREEFVTAIKEVSAKLMTMNNGSRHFNTAQQEILEVIEKAARKYVKSGDASPKAVEGESSKNDSSPDKDNATEIQDNQTTQPEDKESSSSAIPSSQYKGKAVERDMVPDDIDIARPDVIDDIEEESDDQAGKNELEPEVIPMTGPLGEPSSVANGLSLRSLAAKALNTRLTNSEGLSPNLNHFQEHSQVLCQDTKKLHISGTDTNPSQVKETCAQVQAVGNEMMGLKDTLPNHQEEEESTSDRRQHSMDEYIRDTRGFSLETLSIHLIPVKASVLSRAMDLSCIKNLTLLNVGNQVPIWTMLSKENKVRPLALRSVFTDHVSTAFLNCMSQLDKLDELFMLERSSKHRPEPFAPKSTTTIDQIRRLVLKKHMPHLKRLMIKDESNGSKWDVNQKAMILICNAGVQLEELAVSMNIHAVHAFMQYFSGLVNLKAINILHFRNNDTCIWVMRETLNFIVDNLSHHPELQLEWIAMEDERLDRVIRPSQTAKISEEPKRRNKGKGKAVFNPMHNNDSLPLLPISDWGTDSESEEDEDDAFNYGKRLRLKTVGVLQFYEVWGIKIFDKEIRSGRL
ncbi:hypothetical protein BGZ63DRAFT_422546 [Mariannaea sp. PMI_226]|nr:hypothetical protein BGZ63DRAFT_422546 [Mariannaea sp. PMI_226]